MFLNLLKSKSGKCELLNPQQQALQVIDLRVVQVDRVVHGVAVALDDAHEALSLAGGVENRGLKQLLIHLVRTRAGEQQAVGGQDLERHAVHVGVRLLGRFQVGAALGERRRIEHDEVVFARHGAFAQELEGVVGIGAECLGAQAVELHVFLGARDGDLVVVHRIGRECSACECVHREAADVAAAVENRAAFGVRAHQRAHLALIQKETGLLAAGDVDDVLQSALLHLEFGRAFALHPALFRLKSFLLARAAGGLLEHGLGFAQTEQQVGDPVAQLVHAHGRELHDDDVAVLIHDESRDAVALGVDEPPAVGVLGTGQRLTHGNCARDVATQGLHGVAAVECDGATANVGFAVVGGVAQELPFYALHFHDAAVLGGRRRGNGRLKNGVMPVAQVNFAGRFNGEDGVELHGQLD